VPAVSLIVPLEGGRQRARRCLEAIAEFADEPTFEAVLVDDASPDLGPLLGGLSGDVRVVRNERREGFIAGAIKGAAAAESEALVLIRDAALPSPTALAPLLETLAASTGVACARPDEPSAHPTSTLALGMRRADADCLSAAAGAAPGFELAAVCTELARRGAVVTVADAIASPNHAAVAGRRTPGELAELTVVVPTLDATSPRVRACLGAIAANTPAPHQVVVVDNGSPPQGFAAPVNAGLRAVDTPYAVVMNDDVEVVEGWWEPLRAALDEGVAVVFPQTVEGGMRHDFAAWCFGLTAGTIEEMAHAPGEFFDPELRVWFQDTDLLVRLREIGRPPLHVPASQIRHGLSATVKSEDPALRAWIDATIAADRAAFERKHPRIKVGA
jgi:GT2 family glycosyltransferase